MSGAVTAISIVGALATTAFAVDTIATVGLISIGGALAATAAVGATLGAIGQVTGSKELKIAGTVLGVVGGVGSLANSAGLFGSAADFAGATGGFSESAAQISATNAAASGGADNLAGLGANASQWDQVWAAQQAAQGSSPGIVDSLGKAVDLQNASTAVTSPNVSPTMANDQVPTGLSDGPGALDIKSTLPAFEPGGVPKLNLDAQASAVPTDTPGGSFGMQLGAPEVPQANVNGIVSPQQGSNLIPGFGGQGDAAVPNAINQVDPTKALVTGSNTPPPGTTTPAPDASAGLINGGSGQNAADVSIARTGTGGASTDIWSKLFDFATSNSGKLALGALQAGGSFLSGALSPLTPAQVKALDAQATANQAAANLSNTQAAISARQLSNMSQPIPVATRTPPVTGAPAGLINRASAGAVTGVPA